MALLPLTPVGRRHATIALVMHVHPQPSISVAQCLAPMLVALVFIAACSRLREPHRRQFSALMIAGAGAAYLGGGLGPSELAFCALLTFMAYRGLGDYRYIAVAWLLHSCWDVVHDLYANPIIPFAASSSFGCAICDVVLAAWYFAAAPDLAARLRRPVA
jgi:hypothetical protein